jgi:hypothetical protein
MKLCSRQFFHLNSFIVYKINYNNNYELYKKLKIKVTQDSNGPEPQNEPVTMLSPCYPDPRFMVRWPSLRPRNIKRSWNPTPHSLAPRALSQRRTAPCLLRSSAPRLPHNPAPRPSPQPAAPHSALSPQLRGAPAWIWRGRHGSGHLFLKECRIQWGRTQSGGGSCSGGEREPGSRRRRRALDRFSSAGGTSFTGTCREF